MTDTTTTAPATEVVKARHLVNGDLIVLTVNRRTRTYRVVYPVLVRRRKEWVNAYLGSLSHKVSDQPFEVGADEDVTIVVPSDPGRIDHLTREWEDAFVKMALTPVDYESESDAYRALVDEVEAQNLNGTRWDPRSQE